MENRQMSRRIGHGYCGSLWTLDDVHTLKREDGVPGRDLLNDYDTHQKILKRLSSHTNELRIQIPGCHQFTTVIT